MPSDYVNSVQSKEERRFKYAELRRLGYTVSQAQAFRDVRESYLIRTVVGYNKWENVKKLVG